MKFLRKRTDQVSLADIAPGECFRFPGTNSMAYQRLMRKTADEDPCLYASVESGQLVEGPRGLIVIPIDVELREV